MFLHADGNIFRRNTGGSFFFFFLASQKDIKVEMFVCLCVCVEQTDALNQRL